MASESSAAERSLVIAPGIIVPRGELLVRVSRASGAGGQHVNKTSTRVEIVWNVLRSPSIDDASRARILERLATRISTDGSLRVVSADTRSQATNRERAEERLAALVRAALVVPKARRATKPTRASREKRLESKRHNSLRKRNRNARDD